MTDDDDDDGELSPQQLARMRRVVARRNALLARGLTAEHDLAIAGDLDAMVFDPTMTPDLLLDYLERHVAALEARFPHSN